MMSSYTSISRAKGKQKAAADRADGKITDTQYKAIVKEIDRLNADEVRAAAAKRSGSSRPISLSQMVKGKPDRELRKGGMPFNKGGMSSHKGNFDMRKGGMFAK